MSCRWLMVALALLSSCSGDKREPKPVARAARGLNAVPAQVSTLVVVDVAKMAKAPLARRAVLEMLARDPELAKRVAALLTGCKLEVGKDVKGVIIAMGVNRDDSLLLASGQFDEAALAACVGKAAGASGGELTQSASDGYTVYRTISGPKAAAVFFAVVGTDMVAVASSKTLLAQSLGSGPKLKQNHRLLELLGRVDKDGALWAVGLIPTDIGAVLVGKAGMEKPPQALALDVSLDDGLKVRLQVEMVHDNDAKSMVILAKPQLQTAAWVVHKEGLSDLVSKISIEADGRWVALSLKLAQSELGEILARLHRTVDTPKAPQQNPPAKPPNGAEQE